MLHPVQMSRLINGEGHRELRQALPPLIQPTSMGTLSCLSPFIKVSMLLSHPVNVQARELEEEAAAQRAEEEELAAIEAERQQLLQEAAHLRAFLPKHALRSA